MVSTNPARGMRDFLPADVRKREYVIGIIKSVYESYGFEPLETPAVENIDTLMGKYGDEGNQLVFKILKRGEKLRESRESGKSSESGESKDSRDFLDSPDSLTDLALRYDLTVPLARVVANNRNELPKFFKRYQIQPVWRADRPARGRFREFYQCDVDIIGSSSMMVEVELISAVGEIFTKLGFGDFQVRINHRQLLSAILDLRIPESKQSDALVSLDKLDKIGIKGVTTELVDKGISLETAREFIDFFSLYLESYTRLRTYENDPVFVESNRFALNHFETRIAASEKGKTATENLRLIITTINSVQPALRLRFDPSLARGISYYTGAIMEINVPDLAGSLGGGGRYDGLIGMFGKEQIPACGFSLGLERILVVMEERGMFPQEIADSTPADVMVTIWNEDTIADSLKLANELRSSGLRVTLYPEADKLGKQIKYADSIGVPYVCVLGESEIADGKVTLKNMKTGEQQTYPRAEVASKIKV